MAKEAIKKTGTAITEAALRSVMPDLNDTLKAIREDIRGVRDDVQKEIRAVREDVGALRAELHTEVRTLHTKADSLRDEMLERFANLLATVNEVSHRVTRLDGRIEGHMEAMRLSLMAPARPPRKRKAG